MVLRLLEILAPPLARRLIHNSIRITLMKLTFYGGVKSVTGANYLIEEGPSTRSGRPTRALVDCGLQQGSNFSEKQNWNPFLYNPAEIDAVFITHAHIDHIGRLPSLVKAGFKGKIYSTPPTKDAAELLLLDSDHILAQTAERLKMPLLFSSEDIPKVMELWEGVEYYHPVKIGELEINFYNAGHILGSSFLLIQGPSQSSGRRVRIIFSGDLGNSPAPLLGDKDTLPETDYCLIESTYGNRVHENLSQRKEALEDVVEDTVKQGGVLLIPAFAMERTQELIYELNELAERGRIPRAPIFIDSPLAIKLIDVYKKYQKYLTVPVDFNIPGIKMTLTTEESKSINDVRPPKIIIAGSGMSHGGRILHHERRYLPDPKSTIVIIGYQATGSLGRQILDGAKTVRIFGEDVPVRCQVRNIPAYSAHADQPQLLKWLQSQRQNLKKVFVAQGEEIESNALSQKIRDEMAVQTEVPQEVGASYEL